MESNKSGWRRVGLHLVRVAIFVGIVLLIRLHHLELIRGSVLQAPIISDVADMFPDGNALSEQSFDQWVVFAEGNRRIGRVFSTYPDSKLITGFSGPTNVLVGIDVNDKIAGIRILESEDTDEHVEQVLEHEQFMCAFDGVAIDDVSNINIDAVAGATLTSTAIAESIIFRLSGERKSLKFEPIDFETLRRIWPNANAMSAPSRTPSLSQVFDSEEKSLGYFLRTSPAGDSLIGYGGPTDSLVVLNSDKVVQKIMIVKSFDNEPYVGYVRDDPIFSKTLNGTVLQDLANLDLADSRFDGVSGATMTSQSIFEAIQLSAIKLNEQRINKLSWDDLKIKSRDIGTVCVVLLALLIGFTRLRGNKHLRLIFQLVVIGYLGLINGDMLSQALIYGWSKTNIPWTTAAGLVFLSLSAMLVPMLSKRNIYCSHICPHGALQEIIKRRSRWRIPLKSATRKWLKFVPALLLVWCFVVAFLNLPFSLVGIEPFNAWIFRVAGWSTIAVAVVGLLASVFSPMAYCKFGCPTGALLNFLRFGSSSDRWSRSDSLAVTLLLFAVAIFWF